MKKKKKNVKWWTSEEVEALLHGIEKHGRKWASILKDPQFASSLANRSQTNIKDKWRNLGRIRSCDELHTKKKVRQDYMMRSPSKSSKKAVVESNSEDYHTPCTTRKRRGTSSIIEEASKPRVVEELSESKGYHISCTITRQRRWTRNSIISEVEKIRAVKELCESQEYLNPCTIACQRRGAHDSMINQASKERVVEGLSDSEDHLNPCIITYQRRWTHDIMTKQAGEERVVEGSSDSQDYHIPCTINRQRRSTRNAIISEASSKSVVKEFNESQEYLNPCLSTLQKRVTRSIMKKQAGEERVVEDISDSKDYYNQCTIAWQRRSTRSSMVNRTREEIVVEELSDSLDYHKSPTTTRKGKGTCNSKTSHASKIRVVEELSDFQDYHNPCTYARQTRGTRRNRINQAKKLDSEEVHSYLEKIWVSFPEDRKSSFTRLDPLWYILYSDDSKKEKVLNWIRKKDIFSKSYVIFPIVQWGHWSVLIFCHFGESIGSKFKTPCIVLLDSLAKADHSQQLEPIIRKFVLDIYKNAQRTEDIKLLRKMPFLVPKVPQQRDGEECGFFVLYYIKLFVENAPESFSISDGYPYFMNKDWFNSEGLDSFFRTLDASHDSI